MSRREAQPREHLAIDRLPLDMAFSQSHGNTASPSGELSIGKMNKGTGNVAYDPFLATSVCFLNLQWTSLPGNNLTNSFNQVHSAK